MDFRSIAGAGIGRPLLLPWSVEVHGNTGNRRQRDVDREDELKTLIGTSTGVDPQGRFYILYPSRWTGTIDKNPFYFYPFELGYASTLLKRETAGQIKMIDAGVRRLDRHQYAELIESEAPDVVVIESATRCFHDDRAMLERVKKSIGCTIIIVGQHAAAFPEETREIADYVIGGEYEVELVELIRELESGVPAEKSVEQGKGRRKLIAVDDLPWPEDEDVSRLDYVGPLPGHCHRQIQVYASRGCPLQCDFCVAVHVYYERPNWRPRAIPDIIAELTHLAEKYEGQFDGFFFDEETHLVNRRFLLRLCAAMKEAGLDHLRHSAEGTYFSLDDEVLEAMYDAGYRQIKLGIETANAETAAAIGMNKKFDLDKLRSVLTKARDLGFLSYGNFLVGARESTFERDMETAELVRELLESRLIREMQVAMCTPQPGTPFYSWCDENGYLLPVEWSEYDGCLQPVVSYPDYPAERILEACEIIRTIGRQIRGRHDLHDHGLIYTAKRAIGRLGVGGVLAHVGKYYSSSLRSKFSARSASGRSLPNDT